MGKGDKRSKRGKIFAGSYGKSRPKPQTLAKIEKEAGKEGKDDKGKKEKDNKKVSE